MNRLSLRVRLLLLTIGLLLAGLGTGGLLVAQQLQGYLLDRVDDRITPLAEILSRAQAVGDTPATEELDPDLLAKGMDFLGRPYIAFLDAEGTPVTEFRSPRIEAGTVPSFGELDVAEPPTGAFELPSGDGSGRWRVAARAGAESDTTVVVAASLTEIDATIDRLRVISLVSGGVLLILLAIVGWFAIRAGLAPLRRIEQTAAAIVGGDLSHRVPELAPPGTEVGRLGASLNTMLGQLERAFAAQAGSEARMRRFVADVSHELRTPLFGIKGSTELYRMGGLRERTDVDHTMHRIERESARLAALTEDLLLLARLDEAATGGADGESLDLAPMDLRTLAADARHDLRALDPSRPVDLTGPAERGRPDGNRRAACGPPGPAPVHGDEAALRQVVSNLLGNAITHTPPGTPVRIGVGTVDDEAVLEIHDSGPGMSGRQAGRVFDRFYRADSSRSGTTGAGAGLGLSIVRSLVSAHGGRIELRTALGEGAVFRVHLPIYQAPDTEPGA